MRVLLYIEPFPVRNSSTHFADVARRFISMLKTQQPDIDMRLFANRPTLEAIREQTKEVEGRLISPTDSEHKILDSHRRHWVTEGLPSWLQLMEGVGEVTDNYCQLLERIWNTYPFDVIINWGENGAVSKFCVNRSVTRIAMELGCTRPPFLDSIVMDPYGTNGSALVPRLSTEDLHQVVEGVPMSRHEAMLAFTSRTGANPYQNQFHPLPGSLLQLNRRAKRLAFLPLQLFDDANLIRFSPYSTLSEVVLDVVPKLGDAGYTTIVTPHPATIHRPNGTLMTEMARALLHERQESVVWIDSNEKRPSNAQLIAMSDLVVTVNSSVGFEALYYDKDVVVLGDAVYKPKDLFPGLVEYLAGRFDRKTYLDGVGILRRFMLGGYLQNSNITSDHSAFKHRIWLMDCLSRMSGGSPSKLAKGLWSALHLTTEGIARSEALNGGGRVAFTTPPQLTVGQAPNGTGDSRAIASPWLPCARRLLSLSKAKSDTEFSTWLERMLESSDGLRTVVTVGGILNVDHYRALHTDVEQAGVDPLVHYLKRGLVELRKPHNQLPGVTADGLVRNLSVAAASILSDEQTLLKQEPLDPDTSLRRSVELADIQSRVAKSGCRLAVVAHLYYRDLVPSILESLRAIPEEFDLIVTLPEWGARRIEAMVQAEYPDAVFYHAANRGRDIGPFMDVLPVLIEKQYDAVLKVQTKRGYFVAGRRHSDLGDLWRGEALESLLGSRQRVEAIIKAFRSNQTISMVGPEPYYLSIDEYGYDDNGALAELALGVIESGHFFAGTMFWVRPSVLAPLIDKLNLSILSFSPENGANEGELAHLVERLFGHVASVFGTVVGAPVDAGIPLNHGLTALEERLHERMTAALQDRKEKRELSN